MCKVHHIKLACRQHALRCSYSSCRGTFIKTNPMKRVDRAACHGHHVLTIYSKQPCPCEAGRQMCVPEVPKPALRLLKRKRSRRPSLSQKSKLGGSPLKYEVQACDEVVSLAQNFEKLIPNPSWKFKTASAFGH